MDKIYENLSKYGEEMKGKFSHKPSGNGMVISVTSPFVQEIHIECDNDIYNHYGYTYSLLAPQADHPDGNDRIIYYNIQKECYYKCEWGRKNPEQQEPKWGYIWIEIDSRYIVKHTQEYDRLQAHFRAYHNIHRGQLCVFTGYAIDPNGECKLPSTIESKLIFDDRTKWFYNPWSFKVSLFNEDTIDDLVEEIPISKEMTHKMVLYHQEQDKIKQQKEKDDKDKKKKEDWETFWNKVNAHIEKYEKIYRYVVLGGFIGLIISIIQLAIQLTD